MSLWKRREIQSYGRFYQPSLAEGAGSVSSSNPASEQFDESGITKPKDLVNYLLAVQKKKFNHTILDNSKLFTYSMLQSHAKRLMQKYPAGQLKRAVKVMVDIALHPFSFKKVEEECQRQLKTP